VEDADHAVRTDDRDAGDGGELRAEPRAHDVDLGEVLGDDRLLRRGDPAREPVPDRHERLLPGDPLETIGGADAQVVVLAHEQRSAVGSDRLTDPPEQRLERFVGVHPLERGVADREDPGERDPRPRFGRVQPGALERLRPLADHRLERLAVIEGEGASRAADREHTDRTARGHDRDEPPALVGSGGSRTRFEPSGRSRPEDLAEIARVLG
jgi:hypothetical protein